MIQPLKYRLASHLQYTLEYGVLVFRPSRKSKEFISFIDIGTMRAIPPVSFGCILERHYEYWSDLFQVIINLMYNKNELEIIGPYCCSKYYHGTFLYFKDKHSTSCIVFSL